VPHSASESPSSIIDLRKLRLQVESLQSYAEHDLAAFEQPEHPFCYFRLPTQPLGKSDTISVTPTCTAWMSLSATHLLERALETQKLDEAREKITKDLQLACQSIFSQPWDTGKLPENNAFTVSVVARGVGFLANHGALDPTYARDLKRIRTQEQTDAPTIKLHDKTLKQILELFLGDPESLLRLEPFPASPTIAYWLVDAARKLSIELELASFQALANWAAVEFRRLFALYSMRDASTQDPINLAMAACLCSAIRKIGSKNCQASSYLQKRLFPSNRELLAGIRSFFDEQNKYGVWNKYFPIFHYPASGPNYCWHFEVLEAVIAEFPILLEDPEIIEKVQRSICWLEENRHAYLVEDKSFSGWHGGGDVVAVRQNLPESWPTCVAHIFLAGLRHELDIQLRQLVLNKYSDRVQLYDKSNVEWARYMDSSFIPAAGIPQSRCTVKKMVEEEIVRPVTGVFKSNSKLEKRHSAVLFGPPGTAKTTLCRAVAQMLGWPYLELSPSDFLGGGLDQIYSKVNEVFEDLADLWGAVVLFDEMDALVRNRDLSDEEQVENENDVENTRQSERQLDVTETLLTTSMLPKLAKLHDGARVIYFMATNFIGSFDGAIIRSGRFDLLVHLGPPSTEEKMRGIEFWFRHDRFKSESLKNQAYSEAKQILNAVLGGEPAKSQFARFTFGEVGKFFDSLRIIAGAVNTTEAIQKKGVEEIKKLIANWSGEGRKITLWEYTLATPAGGTEPKRSTELKRFLKEATRVSIQ
jgi:hypothetical protein